VKVIAIVDRHGLLLAVTTHAANHHEVTLAQLAFDFYLIEAKPENLIGDRAYDSDKLDAEMREQGTEMIASHRSNRVRKKTQDGRRLHRYERRWIVEQFFAWIQWQRRLLVRWEYHPADFLGFVQLAALCIPLKQFRGSSMSMPFRLVIWRESDRAYPATTWLSCGSQSCSHGSRSRQYP
jgi:transposase